MCVRLIPPTFQPPRPAPTWGIDQIARVPRLAPLVAYLRFAADPDDHRDVPALARFNSGRAG